MKPTSILQNSSISSRLFAASDYFSKQTALDFYGKKTGFQQLCANISVLASGLLDLGLQKGDRIMVCMPNIPQAVTLFYAINRMGGVAVMVHPLLSADELLHCMKESRCRAVCTLDALAEKFLKRWPEGFAEHLILTSLSEELPPLQRIVYSLSQKKKPFSVPPEINSVSYASLKKGAVCSSFPPVSEDDPAAILFSGGTTGDPKGILLSNKNFNALADGTKEAGDCIIPGHTMLAVLPLFHGFGLGVCLHTALLYGCRVLLIPRFSQKTFTKILRQKKPNYVAGVPTLFEAMLRCKELQKTDLSFLEGVFCGGDSLSPSLKDRMDSFLLRHHAKVRIREGYGTTECVTVCCLTPNGAERRGSIGLPFSSLRMCICQPGTSQELPAETPGEICVSGPTVMAGYDGHPEETEKVLLRHADGRIYLHTGDFGKMDRDGYVYFIQRLKRIIISSGYNLYPSKIEEVLNSCQAVRLSAVVGVPDDYRGQRVKAFVVPNDGYPPNDATKALILETAREHMAKFSLPAEIEFMSELPTTKMGKIDTLQLEKRK